MRHPHVNRFHTLLSTTIPAQEFGQGAVLPVFVTCDPARDSQSAIKTYLKGMCLCIDSPCPGYWSQQRASMTDFHPSMVGLTGTYDQIKAACKSYRVYFSTPPNAKATDDYLVDHSILCVGSPPVASSSSSEHD